MFKNEKKLLNALAEAMRDMEACDNDAMYCKTVDIDDYHNDNTIIDLTNVEGKNEVDDDKLTNFIKLLSSAIGVDTVTLNIETPDGKTTYRFGKDSMEGESSVTTLTPEEVKENYIAQPENKCCQCDKAKCQSGNCSVEDKNEVDEDVLPIEDNDRTIVLRDGGGKYNPLFYNAVLHICNNMHFPEEGVYAYYDDYSEDDVNAYIILPNVWGLICSDVAEEMMDCMKDGIDVYIIHPETYELIPVNDPFDIADYMMSELQEEML